MHDILGWIANVFFVFGMISLAHKKIKGFYFNTVGNVIYIEVGRQTETYSLMVISVFLICVNVYGVWKWKKDGGNLQ